MLPFDAPAFFALFAHYNAATWPAPAIGFALLAAALGLALRPSPWAGRAVAAILALAWAWTGVAYHWVHFAQISFLAPVFALLFVAQALLLAWTGLVRGRLVFRPRRDAAGRAGLAVALVALLGLPLADLALGPGWPALRLAGVAPGPTALLSIGLLLLADGRVRLGLLALPLAWALIGAAAAVPLGIWQDLALPAAGLAALALALRRRSPGCPA